MTDEIPPAFNEFAAGSQIAGYRLEEQIGRGGMAVVFRAYDARLDRHVALKILAPGLALDDAFRRRFIRESRAAAAVDHPNIIPVFDAGEARGVLFIAMRFVHGRDVRTLLDRTGPLPPARASDIITQVAAALDAAHARGLVHRDVKPANMLLDESAGSGRQDHVYLSDFGLTKHSLSETGITSQGQVLGTLDYIAPEQIEGRPVDGRTDLYSLACAAFELLAGAPPFRRSGGLAVVWAQLSEPPPPLTVRRPELPPAVDDVLARAMAKSPADRFLRCGEFAGALRGALELGSAESGRSGERQGPNPATQVAVIREGLASGPAGDLPWVGEAAPAEAAVSAGAARSAGAWVSSGTDAPADARSADNKARAGESAAATAAPAGDVQSIRDAAPPGDSALAASSIAQEDAVSADGATPPWGTPSSWRTAPSGSAPSGAGAPSAGIAGSAAGTPSAGGAQSAASATSLWDAARSRAAGPATEAATSIPAVRSTTPGLTEPGVKQFDPYGYGRGGGPRGPWWRSRAALSAAAAVIVLGIAGGAFALLHGGGGNIPVPVKSEVVASAKHLSVREQTVTLGGGPFGVVTLDAQYSFVSLGDSVAVLKNGGSLGPTRVATIPAPGARKGLAITPDGRYLLAAEGGGAYVINVKNAEAGDGRRAIMGTITSSLANGQAVEVSISPDNRFAFVTLQNSSYMAVFDLHQAMTHGFGQSGFVGLVPTGQSPVGIAQSPDGKLLYVTTEVDAGRLVVVNMHLAETNPKVAVTTSAAVGAGPARVIVSRDGSTIWVTDRDSNALVALSADKLLKTPSQAIIARVSVGQSPIGLAFVKDGTEIVIAEADLPLIPGEDNLAVISTAKALAGEDHAALLGYIAAGAIPRELAVPPDGKTLLSTDNGSGQLQAVDVGSLP